MSRLLAVVTCNLFFLFFAGVLWSGGLSEAKQTTVLIIMNTYYAALLVMAGMPKEGGK